MVMFSAALVLAVQKPWLALKLPGEDIVSESPCWAPSPSCHAHPVPGLWLYWFAGALLLQMSGGEWECVRGCWPDVGRWPPFHLVVLLSVWASRYIYVSTGDPQRPPWSLAKSPGRGRDSGNFCRLKKPLLVLMSWAGLRIQTLSSTFAKRSSL